MFTRSCLYNHQSEINDFHFPFTYQRYKHCYLGYVSVSAGKGPSSDDTLQWAYLDNIVLSPVFAVLLFSPITLKCLCNIQSSETWHLTNTVCKQWSKLAVNWSWNKIEGHRVNYIKLKLSSAKYRNLLTSIFWYFFSSSIFQKTIFNFFFVKTGNTEILLLKGYCIVETLWCNLARDINWIAVKSVL